jgi:hypothetical protein
VQSDTLLLFLLLLFSRPLSFLPLSLFSSLEVLLRAIHLSSRSLLSPPACRGFTECTQPVEVVSYKIGVCKVSPANGKECRTEFERMSFNGRSSVVLCRPFTGRMHQIRVHLQYLGFPVINDPLYNHVVFGPDKGKGGIIGKSDDQLIQDLISIHNAENWLGMDGDSELSMFNNNNDGKKATAENADASEPPTDIVAVNGSGDGGSFRPASSASTSSASPTSASPPSSTSSASAATHGGGNVSNSGHVSWAFDPANPLASLENNPSVPRNCTITRPPPITKPTREPVVLREPLEGMEVINEIEGATTEEEEDARRYRYRPDKMTWDPHCYECKVRYRDPKPGDLVMYLHAWRYKVSLK